MIDDDTLTLYFYGDELDAATMAQIDAQREVDPDLAARYIALSAQLTALQASLHDANTPATLNASLHDALIHAAAEKPPAVRWAPWSVAATVVLAAVLLMITQRPPSAPLVADSALTVPATESTRTARLVQSHLIKSRLQLVRFERAHSTERGELIGELIAQTRSIENSARRAGDDDLARFLRAFEPVLERLASTASDADSNQQLLDQLNFELGAMLTKLDAPASESALSF